MVHFRLVYLLAVSSFFAAVSCDMCNGTDTSISAPEVTLSELDSNCDADHESRTPACVSAMNQYCSQTTFPTPIETLGVSRDSGNQRVSISCVESSWTGDVTIGELMQLDGGCNEGRNQERQCLSAVSQYCMDRFGENYSGISQGVGSGTLEVHCFESTRKENVRADVMRSFDAGCHYLTSHSRACFRAASMFCNEYFQSDGGITTESNIDTISVACYSANYTGEAYIIRNNDFYESLSEVETVCDIDYDLDSGYIALESPEVLKSQVYDNRNSTQPLDSSFTFSRSVTESSTFTVATAIGLTVSTTIMFGIPMLVSGNIQISTTIMSTFTRSTMTSETRMFSQSSSISVPPGKMIRKEAKVTISTLDVPYTATVRTRLGAMRTIEGTWTGTTTNSYRIEQEDITKTVK